MGSLANTSMAAPAILCSRRASISASSSTTALREALMKYAVGFMRESISRLMQPVVSGVTFRWQVTKSDSRMVSSRDSALCTPISSRSISPT